MSIRILMGIFFLFSLCPTGVFAHHQGSILGATNDPSTFSIPATIEGPGLILPDSTFYFLDNLKQQIRLALSFTPQAKAKTYQDIAGERLAEFRFMLVKNDKEGIRVTLAAIDDAISKEVREIEQAQLRGVNTKSLVENSNESIKNKIQILDIVSLQAKDSLQKQIEVTTESLVLSKMQVEDLLSEDQLSHAIQEDIMRQSLRDIDSASQSATIALQTLTLLEQEVSKSANKALLNRKKSVEKTLLTETSSHTSVPLSMSVSSHAPYDDAYLDQVTEIVNKAKQAEGQYQSLQKSIKALESHL